MAHIDHGKSTLADRFIDLSLEGFKLAKAQVLDRLKVEQERGITIKSQSCSIIQVRDNKKYLLNFVDTPGHSDFSFEVLKSLYAVESAILLIDGNQGIQSQTMANFLAAKKLGLHILPVVNKIDTMKIPLQQLYDEIEKALNVQSFLGISAKTGQNVDLLIQEII